MHSHFISPDENNQQNYWEKTQKMPQQSLKCSIVSNISWNISLHHSEPTSNKAPIFLTYHTTTSKYFFPQRKYWPNWKKPSNIWAEKHKRKNGACHVTLTHRIIIGNINNKNFMSNRHSIITQWWTSKHHNRNPAFYNTDINAPKDDKTKLEQKQNNTKMNWPEITRSSQNHT